MTVIIIIVVALFRFILGEDDVCQCTNPGFINDADVCFQPIPCNNKNKFYSSYCCDTFPDGVQNFLNADCASLLQGKQHPNAS
jgi:hypothetical protein